MKTFHKWHMNERVHYQLHPEWRVLGTNPWEKGYWQASIYPIPIHRPPSMWIRNLSSPIFDVPDSVNWRNRHSQVYRGSKTMRKYKRKLFFLLFQIVIQFLSFQKFYSKVAFLSLLRTFSRSFLNVLRISINSTTTFFCVFVYWTNCFKSVCFFSVAVWNFFKIPLTCWTF